MEIQFIYDIMTELKDTDRAIVFDVMMFSKLLKKRLGYYSWNEDIEVIREIGRLLDPAVADADNIVELLQNADRHSEHALDIIKYHGGACCEYWKLQWNEYVLFNRIVNSHIFRKLAKLYEKFRCNMIDAPGSDVLHNYLEAAADEE